MKNLNKLAVVFAIVAVTGSAFAADANDSVGNADDTTIWRNGTGDLCWRAGGYSPANSNDGCNGNLAQPAAAQPTVAQPAAAQPQQPQQPMHPAVAAPESSAKNDSAALQKVTFAADAFFDVGKSELKPQGRIKLDDLVRQMQGIALEVIVVLGHTDSSGSDVYNQNLSVRRAEAVKAYLASTGIDPNRIYAEGKGKREPIADNSTAEGRAKNRRVEVEVASTRAKN